MLSFKENGANFLDHPIIQVLNDNVFERFRKTTDYALQLLERGVKCGNIEEWTYRLVRMHSMAAKNQHLTLVEYDFIM